MDLGAKKHTAHDHIGTEARMAERAMERKLRDPAKGAEVGCCE